MIFVTGDIHGKASSLSKRLKKISKKDYLIVCGDFGFIWNGDKAEEKILKSISDRNILFIDGANENFSLLEQYDITDFYGGHARHICGNIYYLCRGEYYDFRGTGIFVFGGGETEADGLFDKGAEKAYPCADEMRRGAENLAEHGLKVDYIITHEAPEQVKGALSDSFGTPLNRYFTGIMNSIQFKEWYFGCYHKDRSIASKYHAMFERVLPLAGTESMNSAVIKREKKTAEKGNAKK